MQSVGEDLVRDPSPEDVFDAAGERGGLNADWVHTVWAIRDIAEGTVFIFDEEDDTYSVIVRDMSDGDFEWCEPLLTSDNAVERRLQTT